MAKEKKSDLGARLITAVVAIPLILAVLFAAPAWTFTLVIAGAGAISAWEYCQITYGDELPAGPWVSAALTLPLVLVMHFAPAHTVAALLAALTALFLFVLFGWRDQERATHQLGSSVTALVYGGLMLGCLALMRQVTGEAGPLWVVLCLAIIWGSDTGAYFAGRALGKHKLYEAVSPNKTIEGALGGVATSVLFTLGFDLLYAEALGLEAWTRLELWQVLLLAIPGNFLGQTGDLCESLIKRAHGVKDSGTIIYGHGGMLDRIDALIFASPWFYYFVITFTAHGEAITGA